MTILVHDIISPIVAKHYKERDFYQGMSQSGKCIRQLWLKARGYGEQPTVASMTTFADGHKHEEAVIEILKKEYTVFDTQVDAVGNKVSDEQWELTSMDPVFRGECYVKGCDCKYYEEGDGADQCCPHSYQDHIQNRGHIDGVIEMETPGGEWGHFILEVKSHNTRRFLEVVRDGVKKAHWSAYLQIQKYLSAAGQLPFPILGAYYVGKSKEDPKVLDTPYYGEIIEYDSDVAEGVVVFEHIKRSMLIEDKFVPSILEYTPNGIQQVKRQFSPLCKARYCNVRGTCFQYGVGREAIHE